jgi:hypothetical protein
MQCHELPWKWVCHNRNVQGHLDKANITNPIILSPTYLPRLGVGKLEGRNGNTFILLWV